MPLGLGPICFQVEKNSLRYPHDIVIRHSRRHDYLEIDYLEIDYLECATLQIGYQSTSSPYWVHAATATVVAMIPPLYFNAYVLRMHKDLRRRWLQKHR
jgi:hypothetical protein